MDPQETMAHLDLEQQPEHLGNTVLPVTRGLVLIQAIRVIQGHLVIQVIVDLEEV